MATINIEAICASRFTDVPVGAAVSQPKGEDAAERCDNGPRGNQPSFSLSALSVLSVAGFDSFALRQQVVGCCDCLPVQLSD